VLLPAERDELLALVASEHQLSVYFKAATKTARRMMGDIAAGLGEA